MNFKNLSLLFGAVFLLIGILGFVPGVTNDQNLLLGIFQVGPLQNLIHILSGVAALVAATSEAYGKLYFKIFGVVYTIVAIVGIVQGDTVLGLFAVNAAENILHVVLAVVFLAVGFGLPAGGDSPKKPAATV